MTLDSGFSDENLGVVDRLLALKTKIRIRSRAEGRRVANANLGWNEGMGREMEKGTLEVLRDDKQKELRSFPY